MSNREFPDYKDMAMTKFGAAERRLNLTIPYYPKKDWANPGCQSKQRLRRHEINLSVSVSCIALAALDAQPITREALEGSMFQSIGAKPGTPPQLLLQFKVTAPDSSFFETDKRRT